MDSEIMIKEINDNLQTIINNIKENKDNSISSLENIQTQMDKKVEEAKKYKVQVDLSKAKIKELEEENNSLEISLSELTDKYGKMNLISVIEAGNREIKTKINDNLKTINKEVEHIQDLTNRARTIKDLLINLKKDKTIKEERNEIIKSIYEFYNKAIGEIITFSTNHSNSLSDYVEPVYINNNYVEDEIEDTEIKNIDLDNTMVFDEIANIDEDENDDSNGTVFSINDDYGDQNNDIDQVDDSEEIQDDDVSFNFENESYLEDEEEVSDETDNNDINNISEDISEPEEINSDIDTNDIFEQTNEYDKVKDLEVNEEDINIFEPNLNEEVDNLNTDGSESNDNGGLDFSGFQNLNSDNNDFKSYDTLNEETDRLSKINDLFSTINDTTSEIQPISPINTNSIDVENKIDNAYMNIFGTPLTENDLNERTSSSITDIFGNPIKEDEVSEDVKIGMQIEELFNKNGLEFGKFREDEQYYLKQIYNEDKFNRIFNILNDNKIKLDNLYKSFNLFGEITPNELENLITKLINAGQSVETIGLVLEKLPKVKKYDLDGAIYSYGNYVKDIDITELIMKTKELYNNGGNN